MKKKYFGPTVPILLGVILVAAAIGFFVPIGFWDYFSNRIKRAFHPSNNTSIELHGAVHSGTQDWRKGMRPTSKTLAPRDYSITLLPVDQNMPTNRIIKEGMEPPEELSRSSREKTVCAITNFIANVKLSGFKFNPGDLVKPIRVRTMVNSSATAQTEHAVFGVMWSSSGDYPPTVDHITSVGKDENGADRSFYSLEPGGTSLSLLMDTNLYPIMSGTEDVYPAITNFLALQIPDGNYVLNNVYRPQGPLPLPILVYQFVEPTDYKKVDPIGAVNITVRIGGKDLQPGQAELVAYEDNGIGVRGHRSTFPKPQASLLDSH